MIRVSTEKLPKLIVSDLSYLIYYSIYWFLISSLFIMPLLDYFSDKFNIKSDYEHLVYSIIIWILIWMISQFFIVPIERKLIKRNIFVAWFIKILRKKEDLAFEEKMWSIWL
jgi:hypothetical protein